MSNYSNNYDQRALSANQHNDPGAPTGYETVEIAPGTFETRRVVEQKVDTAAAEMLNLVADVPNQMVDNGRTKSFVFGGTMEDFKQAGAAQDSNVPDTYDGVVINGQQYDPQTLKAEAAPAPAPETPVAWADQMRARYGQPVAGVAHTPPPVPAAKADTWWKKK